jgi:hypothetical protein
MRKLLQFSLVVVLLSSAAFAVEEGKQMKRES